MVSPVDTSIVDAASFAKMLGVERKRTNRSHRPFLLMLLDLRAVLRCEPRQRKQLVKHIIEPLQVCARGTDIVGWYKPKKIVGVIFTELSQEPASLDKVLTRVKTALQAHLTPQQFAAITITTHWYPLEDPDAPEPSSHDKLYPDVKRYTLASLAKRALDIIGSVMLIVLLFPVFLFVGIAVKLTSKGPILFRQKRIGQFGRRFTFLKFRSMYTDTDSQVHQQYVQAFIQQSKNGQGADESLKQNGLFKLSHDPRITPLGHFLRKTSLDELPQLFNVLTGTMSLVGPRPPVPYEAEHYDIWHRRRVLEARPGITGPWQVKGRSRTTFEDMVRLDLQYIDTWSLGTDLKLLIQTPWTVIKCEGAR